MSSVSDFASNVADQLQREHIAAFEQQAVDLDEAGPMHREVKKGIFDKIEFRWRRDDEKIIEQIQAGVDTLFGQLFQDSFNVVDDLYGSMRVPEEENGIVKTDGAGRVVWKTDSRGREIEDWSQLTGQDIEKAILDITQIKLILAPRLNDLLLEAVFARHIADDATHDAYAAVIEGTVAEKNAYASRVARQDKYHAFFRYYLYSQAEVFMKELNNFARVLERIRYWRIDDSGKATP